MSRRLRFMGRIALVAGCLVYVFWDLNWPALGRSLAEFDPLGVFLMALMMWVSFAAGGVRLRYLSLRRVGLVDAFNAEVLGLGLSNVIPAKGGELVKALYMRREAGMSLSRSLSVVFWERFFDLNAVFVLGLMAAVFMEEAAIAVSLGVFTMAVWGVLLAVRKWPSLAPRFSRLLIFEKLKMFFTETVSRTAEGLRPGYLSGAVLYTLPMWISYYYEYHFLLFSAAGFDLSLTAGLSIFLLGALGLAAPSSPGGLGVYEAVIVAALGLYGIEKERAVAAGLVFRFFQYGPITTYALVLMARKGLPLKRYSVDMSEEEAGGEEAGAGS